MTTYKQPKKEKARLKIWKKAIKGLTIDRDKSAILKENTIREMRRYILKTSKHTAGRFEEDKSVINGFSEFLNQVNSSKKASELKVIYFCGPEPENDLDVMLDYGIKIENVWALEQDKKLYGEAVNKAKIKYPSLKVYSQKFKEFCENFPKYKFDIIYLDFTQTLFSTDNASTIHYVFDYGMLSDIGILVTNNAVPSCEDKSKNKDEYLNILSSFFAKQYLPEFGMLSNLDFPTDKKTLIPYIEENFDMVYSAFCTAYPIFYSNIVAPSFRIFKSDSISKQIVNGDCQIENIDYDKFGNFFAQNLTNSWKRKGAMYELKDPNTKRTRADSVKVFYDLMKNWDSLNNEITTEIFKNNINNTYDLINKFDYLFCDYTFINILIQFSLYQVGYPMHINYLQHERFSYKAKETPMYVDIFTFDACRAIYDWLPLFELFENNIQINEKHIIFRCCIDLISGKQCLCAPIGNYIYPCNSLAINEDGIELEYFQGFKARENL